ncbi:hypothetical protein Afil01_24470 [Actinorhabdospora filicis]|uniref:Uncharacterized protein n=1 Tax=Actinorhabdospora filicis TaxID=1785913 RepID=A0A9W6SKM0_9ACTN|nr:hypothetical protein Afil01_24470 [Actinorhabdospora filicis]
MPLAFAHADDRAVGSDAGVGDEDVDAAELGDGSGGGGAHLGRVADVGFQGEEGRPVDSVIALVSAGSEGVVVLALAGR